MTLRAAYALAGALTFVPSLAFLILFRPPTGSIWAQFRRDKAVGTWWVGASLRLLATALAMGGFRVMVSNILRGDQPIFFQGWFDEITINATLILAAAASLLFLFVYLAFRIWPLDDGEENSP